MNLTYNEETESFISPEIHRRELDILQNISLCPEGVDEETQQYKEEVIAMLNPIAIRYMLDGREFDFGVMSALACLFSETFTMDPRAMELQKDFFQHVRTLKDGQEALVYSYTGGFNFPLILKTIPEYINPEELIHEMFMGIYGTNQLRAFCPGFAYIFGGFVCGSMNNSVKQICKDNGVRTPYVIMESIQGRTLHEFITDKKIHIQSKLLCIIQILYTLLIAKHTINYTHYDFHLANIMVRDLGKSQFIPYKFKDNIYYIGTRYIPVIIDNGRSYMNVNGENFGYKDESVLVFDDKPNETRDLMTLLGGICYYHPDGVIGDVYRQVFYPNFDPVTVRGMNKIQYQQYYVYNPDSIEIILKNEKTIEDVLEIIYNMDPIFQRLVYVNNVEDKSSILDCLDGKCADICETLQSVTQDEYDNVSNKIFRERQNSAEYYKSLAYYYGYKSKIGDSLKEISSELYPKIMTDIDELHRRVKEDPAWQEKLEIQIDGLFEFLEISARLRIPDLTGLDTNRLIKFMNTYTEQIQKIVTTEKDYMKMMKFYRDIVGKHYNVARAKALHPLYDEFNKMLATNFDRIRQIIRDLVSRGNPNQALLKILMDIGDQFSIRITF